MGESCAVNALFVEFRLSMSTPPPSFRPDLSVSTASATLGWEHSERASAFEHWLQKQVLTQGIYPESVHSASADASFRRYFRVLGKDRTYIVMDAPPDKENCQPFVDIASLFAAAGLKVPEVLDWDREHGFMLLSDLGSQTMMQVLTTVADADAPALFNQATDTLVMLQRSS